MLASSPTRAEKVNKLQLLFLHMQGRPGDKATSMQAPLDNDTIYAAIKVIKVHTNLKCKVVYCQSQVVDKQMVA